MKKTIINNTTVTVVLQHAGELPANQCFNGVLSLDADRNEVLFEETIRKRRPARNPKLFDGRYISLVRMQNGRYRCYLKALDLCGSGNAKELAFQVYGELISAFTRFE